MNQEKAVKQAEKNIVNKTLSAGVREVKINSSLNRLFIQELNREYKLDNVKFMLANDSSFVANANPTGIYIHLDDLGKFITQNCQGLVKLPEKEGKILVPKKKLYIPG